MRTFIVAFASALGKYDCFQPSLEGDAATEFHRGLKFSFLGCGNARRTIRCGTENWPPHAIPCRRDSYGQRQLKSFSFALGQLGWIDGQNVALMIRWSGGEPRLAEQYANELVELAPDVIVAGSTIGLDAAR